MSLTAAIAMVIADIDSADDPRAIVAHVRATLTLPGAPVVPGAYPIYDDGDDLSAAYIAIVSASDDDIADALTRI